MSAPQVPDGKQDDEDTAAAREHVSLCDNAMLHPYTMNPNLISVFSTATECGDSALADIARISRRLDPTGRHGASALPCDRRIQ